jgi:hypothetical protein
VDDGPAGSGINACRAGMQRFLDEGASEASIGAGYQDRLASKSGWGGHVFLQVG